MKVAIKLPLSFILATLVNLYCTSSVQAQSPTASTKNFNIFVKGNATLIGREIEGPVAVGGNLTTSDYQISFESKYKVFSVGGASIGLAVGGAVKLNSGSLQINGGNYVKIGNCKPDNSSVGNNLKVWYKDNNNASSNLRITDALAGYDSQPNININSNAYAWGSTPVSADNNGVCENVFGTGANQIDMDAAFTEMTTRSGQLKDLADNLPILDQNGNAISGALIGPYTNPSVLGNNPKIKVNPDAINVLTVSAEVWNSIQNINIENIPQGPQLGGKVPNDKFALIINIINFPAFAATHNNRINFPGFGGLSDPQGSYVMYNFPDANGNLELGGNAQIVGTIFAPQAQLKKDNNGNLNGQVIAQSFIHNGHEIHFWPFQPSITPPVVKTLAVTAVSKCVKDAPYVDYNVTPSFDATGKTATIEWINENGEVVKTATNQPLKAVVLFPGSTVSNGEGNGWTGWTFTNGKWAQTNDAFSTLRSGEVTFKVTVDVSNSVEITYPLSTETCKTSPPPPPLPVKLSSFTTDKQNCSVQLKWKVAEATNFSRFAVQRSADAINFKTLSVVAYRDDQKEYSYSDSPYSTESTPVKNYYYRLQQIDTDESFEYSSIRAVESGNCDTRLMVSFYPNPVVNELNVSSYSPIKQLEIYSMAGYTVVNEKPSTALNEMKMDIAKLPSGLYILNVINSEGKHTSKLLKK